MDLLTCLEQNSYRPYGSEHEKVVETMLSKLFFYEDRVAKVYRSEENMVGDFTDFDFRKQFFKQDFSWNRVMAPSIYLNLVGVGFTDEEIAEVPVENAEDFYIEMKRVDDTKTLTNLLVAGDIKDAELTDLADIMMSRLSELTQERHDEISDLLEKSWRELLLDSLNDTPDWAYLVAPKLPKVKTDEISETLKKAVRNDSYFENNYNVNLQAATDNHSDNILVLDGEVTFIDVMPPKPNWKVYDAFYNVCRPAADVAVIGSREQANLLYEEYESKHDPQPEHVKAIYEVENALIKCAYLFMTDRDEIAKQYVDFMGERIADIK